MTNVVDSHDPYTRYLEEKHSKFNTPEVIISEEVVKAIRSLPVTKVKVIRGEVNEVYDVLTESGKSVIVRISRSNHPSFDTEKWAIDEVRRRGVPVPKVLLVEKVEIDEEPRTFSIEEKIEGETLNALTESDTGKKALKKIIIEAGRILSLINSVEAPAFGFLNRAMEGKWRSWQDYVLRVEEKYERTIETAGRVGIPTAMIEQAVNILRKNRSLYKRDTPFLIHGDFSPKHILVRNESIVGILDFEGCRGGDPIFDLSWLNFFHSEDIPLEWIMEGYENKSIFDENFERKFQLYKLNLALDLLVYYESEGNQGGVDHSKRELYKALRYFKKPRT